MKSRWQPYLFWILLAFLAIGLVYPAIGVIALVCMLAPVVIAPFRGRFWCGNYCPRGSFWDNVIAVVSPKKPIPPFFRSRFLRVTMLIIIMTVFTVQTYYAWGDLAAMGRVFINLILITTIVGIILGGIYHQRTWCAFCPMGTLARWFSGKAKPLAVAPSCVGCNACTRACPLQLAPASARGGDFTDGDCLKCGRCEAVCPKKALSFPDEQKPA
jgi:ferredoxin-type protein NapH